ncbi:cation channel sperm-associated auxiliary subunit TMEM249 [Dasypus novemcinctus]|uniref:cation channel sperm-associated auxiliary subunit TMEM249 n=1 Tax=Dasypus novemcinctus TaxID=9361 RepID=UPI00265FD6D5|nr:cation channel sperm-associated auxiliary subunit TMEM249 [Dasypus novemcinctus]
MERQGSVWNLRPGLLERARGPAWTAPCPRLSVVSVLRPAALEKLVSQDARGQVGGLPTAARGKRFQLWALGCVCTERHLAKRLKSNSFYPFMQQQPKVFVLEYYLDTLWKGSLLFAVCLLLVVFGVVSEVHRQATWGFPACGMVAGLWLMVSSLPRRRLVLNHTRGIYHFSIQGRTVCQGPLHLVYVRLALSSDAYGRSFFQLVLCGHKLEPLVLVQLSERYEQMEFLGRHIARKLDINYFDHQATSYRHVVRHWPLGAAFSPGIVLRRDRSYSRPGRSLTELDV